MQSIYRYKVSYYLARSWIYIPRTLNKFYYGNEAEKYPLLHKEVFYSFIYLKVLYILSTFIYSCEYMSDLTIELVSMAHTKLSTILTTHQLESRRILLLIIGINYKKKIINYLSSGKAWFHSSLKWYWCHFYFGIN